MGWYKGPGAQLNEAHYTKAVLSEHYKKMTKGLDSVIAKHTIDQDTVLYRGLHDKPGNAYASLLAQKGVGETFTNLGYSSATSGLNTSKAFGSEYGGTGTLLIIDAPAGQAGYPYGFNDSEKEFLLPRGMTFQINEKAALPGNKNVTVLHVSIVPKK